MPKSKPVEITIEIQDKPAIMNYRPGKLWSIIFISSLQD